MNESGACASMNALIVMGRAHLPHISFHAVLHRKRVPALSVDIIISNMALETV